MQNCQFSTVKYSVFVIGTVYDKPKPKIIISFNFKKLKNMSQLQGKILAGKILVKPQAAETKTASGIIIPDSAKEKPLQGEVVLVGAEKKDEKMEVAVGDVVLYGKYAGTELNIEGTDYLLISQSDVLFIK